MLRVSICWNLKVKVYIYIHTKKKDLGEREKLCLGIKSCEEDAQSLLVITSLEVFFLCLPHSTA